MYQKVFQLHANLYKALANSKRVEIVHLLRHQELSVSQIQKMLGLKQANLSQHLSVLREHGIVDTRRRGTGVFYRLAHPNLIKASDSIREMLIDKHRGEATLTHELRLRMKDFIPLVVDPVCRMRISPRTAAAILKFRGKTYYFCAAGCKNQFLKRIRRSVVRLSRPPVRKGIAHL